MIPKECKRLAEVDFPIAVVSKHSAREKSIRHGHPSTLHLWWARRPLAACRAMLLALLLPDPADTACPADFKKKARALLAKVQGMPDADLPAEASAKAGDMGLRKALLAFIGDFAAWEHSSHPMYLEVGRGLVKAAHPEETPLVVDPFAGGGSIPLEALRLGCEAFASDLNPVACLILKVMLEDIPRYGNAALKLKDDEGKEVTVHGLANALRHVGAQIKAAAEKELAEFYPPDSDGARPIAYLWARTVRCESPKCGAEIPLVRSFWLCKKAARKRALRFTEMAKTKHGLEPQFEVFEPKTEKDVRGGTVARAKATCLHCGAVLHPDRVRAQLAAQRGGADAMFEDKGNRVGGARVLAVVALRPGGQGRHYRLPAISDYRPIWKARGAVEQLEKLQPSSGCSTVPAEEIPLTELRRISLPIYGVRRFRDIFTSRQLLCLVSLARLIAQVEQTSGPVARLLALSLDKTADLGNANTPWKPDAECPVHTLARHDIGMAWDFAESVPVCESSGSFLSAFERTADAMIATHFQNGNQGSVQAADACAHPLPDASCGVWFTDPPYYDSIPYAHLSDFFYVWLRRALRRADDWFSSPLTPKRAECVVDRPHSQIPDAKTATHFEQRVALAMREGVRLCKTDGLACVVFAHKTTEGWEAMLGGMIQGGWTILSAWPITTEMQSRLNARDNASLAASVHIVCRPREKDAIVGDWSEVFRELPRRVGDWMERLQEEGVRGADLVFACIGPALEIYSRYSKVEDPQGREIPLGGDPEASEPHKRGFLAYVWETVGRVALQTILGTAEAKARNSAAGALEEDARLTALFLWTLQSTNGKTTTENTEGTEAEEDEEETEDTGGDARATKKAKGFTLIFDVVRRFAQPLGIHLDVWEDRIVETDKGIVRLLPVAERAEQLFGQAGPALAGDRIEEQAKRDPQGKLDFMVQAEAAAVPEICGRPRRGRAGADVPEDSLRARREATTLDRVHAAMLLQAAGKSNALRALLRAEVDRSPDFLRLANALSALYPAGSDEKRLIDAMLLAVPR